MARSRSFESAAAAAKMAVSRSLSAWKVVRTSLAIEQAVDCRGDRWDEPLMAALAKREARMVEQALEMAGIERIKAKLAELESAAGVSGGGSEPAAPRRHRL